MISKEETVLTKIPLEIIQLDYESSLRILHHKVSANNFLWNYHYHPEIELVFVNDGIGRRHVGNHLNYYQDGDLVLIGSDLPHSGFGFGSLGIHEEVVLQFKESLFKEMMRTAPEMTAVVRLLEKAKQGICFYGETKKRVGDIMKTMPLQSPVLRLSSVFQIIGQLAESEEFFILNESANTFGVSSKDQSRLKVIYNHVEKTYMQSINIVEVAGLVNLSVPAFCNYFKKMVSMTYTDFVNDYRVNKACQLLLSDRSILDVCFACGFTSQSYFCKVFKKIKSKSPMEYRKEVFSGI